MPMDIFGGTKWRCHYPGGPALPITDLRTCGQGVNNGTVLFWSNTAHPYPFGVDPIWHGTKTELPFLNSMKVRGACMKAACMPWCSLPLTAAEEHSMITAHDVAVLGLLLIHHTV